MHSIFRAAPFTNCCVADLLATLLWTTVCILMTSSLIVRDHVTSASAQASTSLAAQTSPTLDRLRSEVNHGDSAAVTQYSPYVWKSLITLSARDSTYMSAGVRLKIWCPHTSPPITGAPTSIWDVHHQVPKSPRKSSTPSSHPTVTHHRPPGDASTFASESWSSFEDGKYKRTGQREVIPLLIIAASFMNPFPLGRLPRAVV